MKQEAKVGRSHINDLLSDRNSEHTRTERLLKDIERLEVHSKQANLKFLGLHEPDPRDNRTDVDETVDTLNYSSNTMWQNTDIAKVHRLGRAPKQSAAEVPTA